MSVEAIQSACDTRFQAMPGLDNTQISWTNVTFNPNPNKTYWAPRIASLDRLGAGAGAKGVVLWKGTYQISVYIPRKDAGTQKMGQLQDALIAHFPRGLTLMAGGLKIIFEVASPRPAIEEPERYHGIVICPWFTHEIPT